MKSQDANFLLRLRAAFDVEAAEHLQAISTALLELEKSTDLACSRELVITAFREAHSLKGASRAVNLPEVETVCQALEGVLAAWRRVEIQPTAESLDPLHAALRVIENLLQPEDTASKAPPGEDQITTVLGSLSRLEDIAAADAPPVSARPPEVKHEMARPPQSAVAEAPSVPTPASVNITSSSDASTPSSPPAATRPRPDSQRNPLSDTLRIAGVKLDELLLQAEEMLSLKLTVGQRATDIRKAVETLKQWDRQWTKRSGAIRSAFPASQVDAAAAANSGSGPESAEALAEFLEWNRSHIKQLNESLGSLLRSADHDRRTTGTLVETLLDNTKKLLMLPFSTLFEMFPKVVRELSREQGKDVELVVLGGEVEIDKRILEEMKDPLIHLLRNAVDHGVELPAERVRQGKPARSVITLAVSQVEGNRVEIRVSDDGAGINPATVRAAAVRHGAISEDAAERLSDEQSIALIFEPEVSTSPIVTEISGRGLGMDIVRGKVEKLGGRVEVSTDAGRGTRFRLLLPLTLATFRGILVRCGDQMFVLPTSGVERVVRVRQRDIQTVESRETLQFNGRAVAFVSLNRVLELPTTAKRDEAAWLTSLILCAAGKRVAFSVDELLDEHEVLVKPLTAPLQRVRNIAGATVLGSGKAVPILNVDDLIKSAARAAVPSTISSAAPDHATSSSGAPADRPASILVAEDSITARMLLKNILESAGHRVKTVVDGFQALVALRAEPFDLVVSDVEMPRVNGFELTEQIRGDAKLSGMPVVLVTALASREHRERGVDVGASAYIVKSSFDQSDLLATVERLL